MVDRPSFNWWMKGSDTSSFKPVFNMLIADFKAAFKTLRSDGVTHGPHVLFRGYGNWLSARRRYLDAR